MNNIWPIRLWWELHEALRTMSDVESFSSCIHFYYAIFSGFNLKDLIRHFLFVFSSRHPTFLLRVGFHGIPCSLSIVLTHSWLRFHLDISRMKGSNYNLKRASIQLYFNKHQTYFWDILSNIISFVERK